MPTIVVDASAAIELLLRTQTGGLVDRALRGASAAAPAHLDAEVLSALGRLVRDGTVDQSLVRPALAELARAPIMRFPLGSMLVDAWSLRANVSLRDALYVTLARRLDASVVTADARLARVPALGIPVTLVG